MGQVYAYDGVTPVVDETAFVHDTAVLIGDAIVGPGCYIGPGAVLRGDFGRIRIGIGCNIQETCVLHAFPGRDTVVEDDGHVGHGAVLHGCHLEPNVLIGMNSVVMDETRIGQDSIIGALAFVKAGSEFEPRSMIVGTPAKRLRGLTDSEVDWKRRGTGVYQALAVAMRTGLRKVAPLPEEEPNRKRVTPPAYDPLVVERAAQAVSEQEERNA